MEDTGRENSLWTQESRYLLVCRYLFQALHGIVEEKQSICPVQSAEGDDDYWDSLLRSQLAELQIVDTCTGQILQSLRCLLFLNPICLLKQFPPCLCIIHFYRHSMMVDLPYSKSIVLA